MDNGILCSNLINQLESLKEKHGDVVVKLQGLEYGEEYWQPVKGVEFLEKTKDIQGHDFILILGDY